MPISGLNISGIHIFWLIGSHLDSAAILIFTNLTNMYKQLNQVSLHAYEKSDPNKAYKMSILGAQISPECLFWPVGGHFGDSSHLVFLQISLQKKTRSCIRLHANMRFHPDLMPNSYITSYSPYLSHSSRWSF